MSIITIIGAGMMGSALSIPASENGNEVRIVGTPLDREIIEYAVNTGNHLTIKRKLPDGVKYYQIEELDKALNGTDFIISGVSSFGVDWFADNILNIIPEEMPVLSVTKGMVNTDDGYLITYLEYYKRKLVGKHLNLNAVGGPCTSYELADKDHSHVWFCGNDMDTLKSLKKAMGTDYYHVSLTTDIVGIECAVAMKNAYSLGVSIAIGLVEKERGKGVVAYNSQAAVFAQGVKEMKKLLALYGGGEDNIVVGAGDMYVTVFGGRTRKIGILLGKGFTYEEAKDKLNGLTLESIVIACRAAKSIKALIAKGKVNKEDFPLLLHIDDVINNNAKADMPWEKFE